MDGAGIVIGLEDIGKTLDSLDLVPSLFFIIGCIVTLCTCIPSISRCCSDMGAWFDVALETVEDTVVVDVLPVFILCICERNRSDPDSRTSGFLSLLCPLWVITIPSA